MSIEVASLRDFAARYTAAWCSQDAARVASFFSPEGSLRINKGVASTGRSAICGEVQSFMTAFPDLRVILDDVVVRGETAEYHWTLLGTHSGPNGTGNSVRISGVEHWRIGVDGLIESSQGYFDESEYQRQLSAS